MNDALFKAILAMDSYNRGYNAGILFGDDPLNSEAENNITKIGNATVYASANTVPAQSIGFYAIAYQYDNQITISYRGTDQFFGGDGIGGDIANGYGVGLGNADGLQATMAFDFYKAVDAATALDISVTGHSMGGGLAGLVGAAYGATGYVFESMAYTEATQSLVDARNLQIQDPAAYALLYSFSDPTAPYSPTFLTQVYGNPVGASPVTAGFSGLVKTAANDNFEVKRKAA